MKTKSSNGKKVKVVTLGCSKNLVDSENLITQLRHNAIDAEHETNHSPADVVVVNTCGFIDAAKEESINTILEYAHHKSKGHIGKLYVTGCLSERYQDQLEDQIPEVDAFFGTLELPALLAKFNANYQHELIGERQIATPAHYAYMKISEGCNRTCAFCAIPLMRGKHISRPIEELVREAELLANGGVKEIILIAQELTYYGLDIYKSRALSKLLLELSKIAGLEWIRLHYAYPRNFPRDVLEIIAHEPKICNYLDIPIQHANNQVLMRMRRQITKQETERLIGDIRSKVPNIALRTTLLVGFPGETDEEFNELIDFVSEQEFDRLGVFQYSHEEGTSAHAFKDNVPAKVKKERADAIMEIQQGISVRKNQSMIGRRFKTLIDRKEGELFIGRTEYDSPDVDNEVLINAVDHYVRIGDFAYVEIFDAEAYDLYGTLKD